MALMFSEPMQIGTKAPQFELQDFEGVTYSLSQLVSAKKGIAVVFTCNHCPYATASWNVLIPFSQKYPDVQFVAINSNDSSQKEEDSASGMKQKALGLQLPFPYLVDSDQSIAKAYKAVCTPDPFLFKIQEGEAHLFYHGRINDNWQHPVEVTENNLEDAIVALLGGQSAPGDQPPSMGCSIKWKE